MVIIPETVKVWKLGFLPSSIHYSHSPTILVTLGSAILLGLVPFPKKTCFLDPQGWSIFPRGPSRNMDFAESLIFSPDPESGAPFFLRREIVREPSDKRQFSPWHLSQNYALNHATRPISMPDSKCSRKGGYCTAVLRGMSGFPASRLSGKDAVV